MKHEHSHCAFCFRAISGQSPDVKVVSEVHGAMHLDCARKVLGQAAFLVPSIYFVPMTARMY